MATIETTVSTERPTLQTTVVTKYVPGVKADGSLQTDNAASRKNLSDDLRLAYQNPFNFSDSAISDGTTAARAAITAADAVGPVLLPPGTYAIASNLTTANHVTFAPGAMLKPASGVTVTLSGGYTADDYQQVFDISASGSFSITKQTKVTPQHFGAVADGTTDDLTKLQAALSATKANAVLTIPPGAYKASGELTIYRGTRIQGSNPAVNDHRFTTRNICKILFSSTSDNAKGFVIDQSEIFTGYVWGISISDLFIEGVNATGSMGIDLLNVAGSVFTNVGVNKFDYGVFITFCMMNTFSKCCISQCEESAIFLKTSATTSQTFNDCYFRQSGWGVYIENDNSASPSNSSKFMNCLIESTVFGGVNVNVGCGCNFFGTYMENVPGTLFKLHVDGTLGVQNGGDAIIIGGGIGGLNLGSSDNAFLIGQCRQVKIIGTLFTRCTNGIVCQSLTPESSVCVWGIEFTSITNLFVDCSTKLHGTYSNAATTSTRRSITDSSRFISNEVNQSETIYQATSQTNSVVAAYGLSGTAAVLSARRASGNAQLVFKNTFDGTTSEVGRFSESMYFKASPNASYGISHFSVGSGANCHHFVNNVAGIDSPALLVSNTSTSANSMALITTKPGITEGKHIASYRTDQVSAVSVFEVAANGNVTNTNNSYAAISDLRLKQNIQDATPKLDDLLKLRIVNYSLKVDPENKQIGVIAQEIEQVFPSLVETGEDGFKSVKYSVLVPMLIKAVQELADKVDSLRG